MYGEGVVAEAIYKRNISIVNDSRSQLSRELSSIKNQLEQQPSLPLEKLVEGVVKLVNSLDFADKKQIIRKLVTKVVATQKEVTVWGQIPILAPEQVGLNAQYRHIKVPTQLPFELKLRLPAPDHGGRGYSDEYITNIEESLYLTHSK